MAILGGSPLGLIGVTSNPIGGYSTFNGGKSRNVSVKTYNQSNAGSLFTGKRRLRAWPNIKTYEGNVKVGGKTEKISDFDTTGAGSIDFNKIKSGDKTGDNYESKALHNNDVYDTSVLNIIEKLAETKAALRPSDFAYCKNLGVYPNNRLMIVRRFAGASDDNIMVKRKSTEIPSFGTIITWVDDTEDFISIDFGEVWPEAKASFTDIVNSIGKDYGRSADSMGLGDLLSKGAGAIPLPGFTEIFQRKFLAEIGVLDEGADSGMPAGNPNLIKEARVRKTIGYDEAGSGLTAKVTFNVKAEYELKFISGIDPTIVWMDLISMILRFGTSESSNYGMSKGFSAKIKKWVNNPNHLVTEMLDVIGKVIKDTVSELDTKIKENFNKAIDSAQKAFDSANENKGSGKSETDKSPEVAILEKAEKAALGLINKIREAGDEAVKGTILKYRTEALGIVNALTGAPSTPWHITIGNPLRPIFCSGDMYTESVKITMGPQLAFNDLPSSIRVEFSLTNARNLGLQEIAAKFNSGYLRTVDIQKTFHEVKSTQVTNGNKKTISTAPIGALEYESSFDDNSGNKSTTPPLANSTTPANNNPGSNTNVASQAAGSTKVLGGNSAGATINKDPKTIQKK